MMSMEQSRGTSSGVWGTRGTQPGTASMSWWGMACLVLLGGALVIGAWSLWGLVRTAMLPTPVATNGAAGEGTTPEGGAARADQYAQGFGPMVRQLDGRSLFYVPSAPGEKGNVVVQEDEEAEGEEGPAPSRYEGPAVTAIALDSVWFGDGKRRTVGQGEVEGVEVVATDPPWGVTVKWRGQEFRVPLFERDKLILKDSGQGK